MLRSFHQYPGTTLGVMAAVGAVKVGAILWETTFSGWPLSHVLMLPLLAGGLALGIGIGHDQLVSTTATRRLGGAGLLFLSATAGGFLFGVTPPPLAWGVALFASSTLIATPVGHALFASLLGQRSSQSHVEG